MNRSGELATSMRMCGAPILSNLTLSAALSLRTVSTEISAVIKQHGGSSKWQCKLSAGTGHDALVDHQSLVEALEFLHSWCPSLNALVMHDPVLNTINQDGDALSVQRRWLV